MKDLLTLGPPDHCKSALAGAIRYNPSRWLALCRFAEDGRLEMGNNDTERTIRPPALGRKNMSSPTAAVAERPSSKPSPRPPSSTASPASPINKIQFLPWAWAPEKPAGQKAA